MFENESVDDLMSLAHETPYGKKCSALWAEAARRAGAEGLESEELWCYLQLASAFTMGGEVTRMVAPFMWVDKRRKERPDLFDERMQNMFAWYYKYLLLVLRDMPQASADECFAALAQMREFYQGLGDSLKAYYLREYYVYTTLGRDDEAAEAYRKWRLADSSELSDCSACDPQHQVLHLMRQGQWRAAVAVGEWALENTENSCSAQPENLYTRMLEPWLRTGNDAKAWPAHVRAMQRNSQRTHFLEHLPEHLIYLELSGSAGRPQRLQRGLDMVVRFLPWWLEAETPMVLMEMAVASARMLAAQPDGQQRLDVTLPGASLPWVKAEDLPQPTIAQASEWCADLALKIAAMFDARPGLVRPHVTAEVTEKLYHLPPVPPLPEEGPIADVSGQFAPVTTDYRIQARPERQEQGIVAEDAQAALVVAIDIHGPWREFSEAQLLAAHEALDTSMPSIYSYRLNLTCDVDMESTEEVEPARQDLLAAHRLLAADQFTQAAQAADRAMRTPSQEPISVRLIALRILAVTALMAGYYEDACQAARHRLNLAAACGLPLVQLDSATLLVHGLMKQQEFAEAAEVAHTALAAMQHAMANPTGAVKHQPQYLAQQTLPLRRLLVKALAEADLDTASAQEALQVAELAESTEDRVDALEQAADGFLFDHEYERSFAAADQLVQAAESMLLQAQAQAVVDESARRRLAQVAERVASILLDVAVARSEKPALVDDQTYAFIESLLHRRLELQLEHLVSEKHTPGYFRADSTEDFGLTALRCRRFDAGLRYLDSAAEQFLALQRPQYAARAWNSAAQAKMLVDDVAGAKEYVTRALELLSAPRWENHKILRESRELLAEIVAYQADETDEP